MEKPGFRFDVFISYSPVDRSWVWQWLLPRLQDAGLTICTDRDSFDAGVPHLVNRENAVAASRRTVLVITPAWMQSEWASFEALLVQHEDPIGLHQRTIPLFLEPCALPRRLGVLTAVDLTDGADTEQGMSMLIDALRSVRRLPDASLQSHVESEDLLSASQTNAEEHTVPKPWHDGLSTKQREAAGHWGGPARILAGPGTGKTRCLIHRVAYLLHECQIPASQVVVLTFTRAAARELQDRLTKHLQVSEAELPSVSTLHAFALRTLMRHQKHAGIGQNLRLADDYEEKQVLWPEIARMVGKSIKEVEKGLRAFEATWNTLQEEHEDWQSIDFRTDLERALRTVDRFYGIALRGELIYRLRQFLDGNPHVGDQLDIRYLLVDEYQDLNYCDQQVIERLEQFGAELFVVGDDDQSIYEFRHAYPEGIRTFTEDRPNAGDYQLTINHRCPKQVIAYATQLMRWDSKRIPRALEPMPSAISGEVHALQFKGPAAEAEGIAAICRAYVLSGQLKPEDITILISRNRLAKRIVEALGTIKDVDLPVTVLTSMWPLGMGNGEGVQGRLAYCLLRLLVDYHDALALRTWIQLQKGIGPRAIDAVRSYCIDQSLPLWEGLTRTSQDPTIVPRGNEFKHRFDELVETLENLTTIESLEELVEKLVGHVQRQQGMDLAEVSGFLASIVEQEKLTQAQELVFALQTFDLKAETQLQANAIRIMTMHKAKGLSSELVIIPALEDDLVPGPDGEEIARRLMYVSMTRSRRTLIMTHAYNRPGAQSYLGMGGGEWQRQRSRFLNELKIRSEGGEPFVAGLPDRLNRTQPIDQIDISALRRLLLESFSDEELMFFCYDHFRSVYHQFGIGMSKAVKVHRLIEHCGARLEVDKLLQQVEKYNPNQYSRFQNQLASHGS